MKRIFGILLLMFATASFADTETINWYVDDSLYNTTTCQTGGDITLQTAPAKRGHTFTGWQVALYDFSTLDASLNGTSHVYNASNQGWTTIFDYGRVSGKSLCSSTYGTFPHTGIPDESGTGDTRYCWCKAIAYTPSGSNIVYENISNSAWVFGDARNSASDCASQCTTHCLNYVLYYSSFRQPLFGITQ